MGKIIGIDLGTQTLVSQYLKATSLLLLQTAKEREPHLL